MPAFVNPPLWTNEQLEADRQQSIARFITERQDVIGSRYERAVVRNIRYVIALFRASNNLRDLVTGKVLAA